MGLFHPDYSKDNPSSEQRNIDFPMWLSHLDLALSDNIPYQGTYNFIIRLVLYSQSPSF